MAAAEATRRRARRGTRPQRGERRPRPCRAAGRDASAAASGNVGLAAANAVVDATYAGGAGMATADAAEARPANAAAGDGHVGDGVACAHAEAASDEADAAKQGSGCGERDKGGNTKHDADDETQDDDGRAHADGGSAHADGADETPADNRPTAMPGSNIAAVVVASAPSSTARRPAGSSLRHTVRATLSREAPTRPAMATMATRATMATEKGGIPTARRPAEAPTRLVVMPTWPATRRTPTATRHSPGKGAFVSNSRLRLLAAQVGRRCGLWCDVGTACWRPTEHRLGV